jgi:hypothetical protein
MYNSYYKTYNSKKYPFLYENGGPKTMSVGADNSQNLFNLVGFSYNHTVAWINVNTRRVKSPSAQKFSLHVLYVNQREYYWNATIPPFAIITLTLVMLSGIGMIIKNKYFKRN